MFRMYQPVHLFLIVYVLLHSQPIKNHASTPQLAVDTVAQLSTRMPSRSWLLSY